MYSSGRHFPLRIRIRKNACRPCKRAFFYCSPLYSEAYQEMKESPSVIRGLIADITRTLTACLVHMDNLFIQIDDDCEEFDEAWLANCQLERSLEFLLELRSEYMGRQESTNRKKGKSLHVAIVP